MTNEHRVGADDSLIDQVDWDTALRVPVKRPSEYVPEDDHLIRLADERERRRAALSNVAEGHG